MHDWAMKLLAVQDIDIKMAKINAQLALVPTKQAEADQIFAAETQAFEKAKLHLKESEIDGKNLDNEISIQQEKKRNFQSKTILIKNNDEYRAALLQIEMCDQVIKNLEDQHLEKMFEIDALKEALAERQKEVELGKKRAQGVKEEYQTLKENCEKQLVQLQLEREKVAAEADKELLRQYNHLRSGRNVNPTQACIVPIMDGACGKCRMRMTAQVCQDTTNGKIVFCPNCASMIYAE